MQIPFERIVQDHGLAVLRVCRALLDEHRAQDAWSETFLAALKAYPDLPDDANVQAWLVTIAHRKAIDELRKNPSEVLAEVLPETEAGQAGRPEARIMVVSHGATMRVIRDALAGSRQPRGVENGEVIDIDLERLEELAADLDPVRL